MDFLWLISEDQSFAQNIGRRSCSNPLKELLKILELISMPTGRDGHDDKVKTKDWVAVTISFGWLTALKTSRFAYFGVVDDLTVNLIKEQGTNESNNEVQRCKHDSMGEDSNLRMSQTMNDLFHPQHWQCFQRRWDYET